MSKDLCAILFSLVGRLVPNLCAYVHFKFPLLVFLLTYLFFSFIFHFSIPFSFISLFFIAARFFFRKGERRFTPVYTPYSICILSMILFPYAVTSRNTQPYPHLTLPNRTHNQRVMSSVAPSRDGR